MKQKNRYVALKKFKFLDGITNDGLISQLIIYYGDAINIVKEASMTSNLNILEGMHVLSDLILTIARIDINLKRKNRVWWSGKVNANKANLYSNQFSFISGLYALTDKDSDRTDISIGIELLQETIETIAFSFNVDISKLIEDLINTYGTAQEVIEQEYAPKGLYTMSLSTDSKGKYSGIELNNKNFNTGVINMDFFKASIFAVASNKEFGIKISVPLKKYIDDLDKFYIVKFYNHDDIDDDNFYTLKSEGNSNRLFRGEEDITDKISVNRKGVTLIPFVNYSMVLVTPEMEKLDDLLDYYNKYK